MNIRWSHDTHEGVGATNYLTAGGLVLKRLINPCDMRFVRVSNYFCTILLKSVLTRPLMSRCTIYAIRRWYCMWDVVRYSSYEICRWYTIISIYLVLIVLSISIDLINLIGLIQTQIFNHLYFEKLSLKFFADLHEQCSLYNYYCCIKSFSS